MKKLISLILVVFLTALIPLSVASETETRNIYDVNGDGTVNMFDYVMVKGIYFGTIDTVPEFKGADINGDGVVNVFDCVLLKNACLADTDDKVIVEAKDISYTAHGLSGSLEEYDIQGIRPEYGMELVSFLITDSDQLNALLDTYLDCSNSVNDNRFIDFAEALSDDYFETKALVITPVYASTGSAVISIEGVTVDGSEILTEISVIGYGEGTSDCQNRLMTAEVNKSDIASCTSARAEIIEANIYGIDYYFIADSCIVTDETLPHRFITGFEQLEELCDGNYELAEYAESLPEDFFDTKVLTLTQIELPDASYVSYTAAITYGKQGLTVYIEKYSRVNGMYPDVFTVMFAVTELDRADIGDVSTFNAKYVD